MSRVLVIDDDEQLARAIAKALSYRGFKVAVALNGETAYQRLTFEPFHACLLDLMLPGMDGWEIISSLRSKGLGIPIVVLSARASQHDVLRTLELGADAYLVKPVSVDEVVARLTAAIRRGPRTVGPKHNPVVTVEELRIDPARFQAYLDGEDAGLTPTEFRLLYALASERGRVLTRGEVLKIAWGKPPTMKGRTVDGCIRQLREKIDKRSSRHRFIHTRYGVGYRFEPVPKEEGVSSDLDETGIPVVSGS